MKFDVSILAGTRPSVVMGIFVSAMALHGCGASDFTGKSGVSDKTPVANVAPGSSATPSANAAVPPSADQAGGKDATTSGTPAAKTTAPTGQCQKLYKQVGELSCTGFNPNIGVPNGTRRFDFRSSQVTGSIDAAGYLLPGMGAGGTNSAALILDFQEQKGDIATYKLKGTVSWGMYPMGTGSFDFSCLANGDLKVVENESAVGLDRSCSYLMSPVTDDSST